MNEVLNRLQWRSLAVGVVGGALCVLGAFLNVDQFFRSYLVAFLFWMGIALGSLSALMLYHMVGGNWGFISRRLLESGTRTLPFMIVLIIPLLVALLFAIHRHYMTTQDALVI